MKAISFKSLFIAIVFLANSSCDDGTVPAPASDFEKANWISEAYTRIKTEKQIKSVGWWNENWEDDNGDVLLKMNSSTAANEAFQTALSDEYFITDVKIENSKIIPTDGKCYTSAFLGIDPNHSSFSELEQSIQEFENQSGKPLSMITCSSIWTDAEGGIHAPITALENIHSTGKTPIMYIEPWTEYNETISEPDPKYNMQKIIDGDWDTELTQMALDIKNTNVSIMAVFGHEVNGSWFPWNGTWNGGETTDEFGDLNKADGPERYVAAYRHIIDIFRNNNVENVTWVAGFDFNSQPEEDWNLMAEYYAGDDYIDWVGLSIYGRKNAGDENQFSFDFIWDYIQPQLQDIGDSKPIIILEMGVGE